MLRIRTRQLKSRQIELEKTVDKENKRISRKTRRIGKKQITC